MLKLTVVRPVAMAKNNDNKKKTNKRQKAVQERRSELKDIRGTLSEISKKERVRMDGLLALHRDFIGRGGNDDEGEAPSSQSDIIEPEVIPDASIDGYFEGADN